MFRYSAVIDGGPDKTDHHVRRRRSQVDRGTQPPRASRSRSCLRKIGSVDTDVHSTARCADGSLKRWRLRWRFVARVGATDEFKL